MAHAVVETLAIRIPASRAEVELIVALLIDQLDAADAATMDMEPDHDGEAQPDEDSAHPVTLCPDVVPLRRVTAFRAPGEPRPPLPPRMPLLPWPNHPPGIDPAKEPNEAAAVLS